MMIASSSGSREVNVGDHVDMKHQGKWEVVAIKGPLTYSPASIGGTPTVVCKPLGEFPGFFLKYRNQDGTLDFCGDSIAAAMIDAEKSPAPTGLKP